MRHITFFLLITIYAASLILPKQALAAEGSICFPPAWGGIVTGFTIDQDLVTIHGAGHYVNNLGHAGGRYYIDSGKSMTMIAEIGVDAVIETVTIIKGIAPLDDMKAGTTIPVSPRINVKEGFGVWKALHLGSTKKEVEGNIGTPSRTHTDKEMHETWYYNTDYRDTECYAAAEIGITFKDGVVYKVMFHNGC